MSVDHIKQGLAKVRYPVSSSASLPPACYHDEVWLGHEMECLFNNGWFCAGRIDQWKEPGDFETISVGNIPVVIVLGKDRELRALSNTCLHRSSQIMSGRGNCKAMVCPFHGWSYDARGRVVSAPRMETAENFTEKTLQLKQFNTGVHDGFVFLSLQEKLAPLDDWLGDFSEIHAGWSFDDLVIGRRRNFDVNCNWKLFIEVFNEYYHLPYVHPNSISVLYPEPCPTDDVMGEYTTQFGLTSGNPALLKVQQGDVQSFPVIETLDEIQRQGTRYTWVYPNMTFAASSDCLWMYHVFPITSVRTHVVQTICFPSDTIALDEFASKSGEYYRRFDLAIEEDIPALEKQQIGIRSPYATQGRFSALEPSVGNFACWYSEVTGK